MRYRKKGQATLEYVVVLMVIIAALIAAAVFFLKPAMNTTVNQASNTIEEGVGHMTFGEPTPPYEE